MQLVAAPDSRGIAEAQIAICVSSEPATEVRCRGERQHSAKLTEEQVREMRRLHAAGASAGELARQFGVTSQNAWCAITGKTWKHVTP